MNYHVSATNLSERKPDGTGMPCWEKDNFQHKIIKLPVIALRKHTQIKGWGTCYCLRTTFFSIVWKAFMVHKISFCCLPSRGIENLLIRNGKISFISLQLYEVPQEWITLVICASVLSKEGERVGSSGFHVFFSLAIVATFVTNKHTNTHIQNSHLLLTLYYNADAEWTHSMIFLSSLKI